MTPETRRERLRAWAGEKWTNIKSKTLEAIKRQPFAKAIKESSEALETEQRTGEELSRWQAAKEAGKKFATTARDTLRDNVIFISLAVVGILPIIASLGGLWVFGIPVALCVLIFISAPKGFRKIAWIPILLSLFMLFIPFAAPPGEIPRGLVTILLLIFFMSVFVGIVGGREARPALGVIVMAVSMVAFSFAYTDVVGMAVFGQYFPAIEAATEGITKPLGLAFDRAGCETGATWKCITEGPVACAQERARCARAQAELVGTPEAVEFESIRLVPTTIALNGENTVFVTLENRGEWEARNVRLSLDEVALERVVYGSKRAINIGRITNANCIAGDKTDTVCTWDLLPKYDAIKGIGGRGPASFEIKWKDMRAPAECRPENCDAGLFPELTFKASFDYDVRVAYAVDVRSRAELERLLLAGANLAGEQARYSGGPLMAAFWAPAYVQAGQATTATASLTNTREGTAEGAVFCIYLPSDGLSVEGKTGTVSPDGRCQPLTNMQIVQCDMGTLVSSREAQKADLRGEAKYSTRECVFTINADIGTAPQKRLDIVGTANYTYKVKETKKVGPIAPPGP